MGKLSTTKTDCYKVKYKWHRQICDSVCFLCGYCLFPVVHKGQAIDSSLSEVGQQQAEAAGQYLRDVRFSDVFVSDMLRAKQVQCLTLKLEQKNSVSFFISVNHLLEIFLLCHKLQGKSRISQ